MKRITLTHKETKLQISIVTESQDPKAAFMEALKEAGVTLASLENWDGNAFELWPQKT